jgi:hypothetical protein
LKTAQGLGPSWLPSATVNATESAECSSPRLALWDPLTRTLVELDAGYEE